MIKQVIIYLIGLAVLLVIIFQVKKETKERGLEKKRR